MPQQAKPRHGARFHHPSRARDSEGHDHCSRSEGERERPLAGLRAHGGELVGELENYENSYWLCYVRGPAGIIVELAEKIS